MELNIADLYPYEPCVTRFGVNKRKSEYIQHKKFDKLPEIVILDGDFIVSHGHHRIVDLMELSYSTVEVEIVNADENQRNIFRQTIELRRHNGQRGFKNYKTNTNTDERFTINSKEIDEYRDLLFQRKLTKSLPNT